MLVQGARLGLMRLNFLCLIRISVYSGVENFYSLAGHFVPGLMKTITYIAGMENAHVTWTVR